MTNSSSLPIAYLGYCIKYADPSTHSRKPIDGVFSERVSVTVVVTRDGDDEMLHEITQTSRSSHQLHKKFRPALVSVQSMIDEAKRWIVANRSDARERDEAERELIAERNRQWHKDQLAACEGDLVAYVKRTIHSLSTTEAARALGLGSARRLKPFLIQSGLLKLDHNGLGLTQEAHGEVVGEYQTVRWNGEGLKAIWDAAVNTGYLDADDAEFLSRLNRTPLSLTSGEIR